MATKPKKKRRKSPRKRIVWAPGHPNRPQGLVFDLCCGKMEVTHGYGEDMGKYRVDLEAHGFSLVLLFNEKQMNTLGSSVTNCVAEARKFVN